MLRLITSKHTLGFKKETTPGVAEDLAAADYDFSVYNVELSPEIEAYARKLARGDYSRDVSIPGKRTSQITFSVDMHSGDTAATAPKYFTMLECCCCKKTTHGATGVSVVTDSTQNNNSATIEVPMRQEGASPKQLLIKLKGAAGDANLALDNVGNPRRIDFTFTGCLSTIETRDYGSMISPTGFDTNEPDAVLAATILYAGTEMFLNSCEINLGNDVQGLEDPNDPSGYERFMVVDREAMMTLDPDMSVTDDMDFYTRHINKTTGQYSETIGSNLQITAPKGQIIESYNPGDRNGHVTNQLRLRLTRDTNGNDELEILQGSKS